MPDFLSLVVLLPELDTACYDNEDETFHLCFTLHSEILKYIKRANILILRNTCNTE